jgi:hypothetical protein
MRIGVAATGAHEVQGAQGSILTSSWSCHNLIGGQIAFLPLSPTEFYHCSVEHYGVPTSTLHLALKKLLLPKAQEPEISPLNPPVHSRPILPRLGPANAAHRHYVLLLLPA